jgi:hypothetical protein
VEYLLGPALFLGVLFNYSYSLTEIFWSFSIFLEAVAILPQLFILQRTGEAETITTHYLAALGAYRGLYIPNWIYRCVRVGSSARRCPVFKAANIRLCGTRRYFAEQLVDPISVTAGLVQTGLYLDFFYVYFTKYVLRTKSCVFPSSDVVPTSTLIHPQGSPGPEVRVASMTFDRHCLPYVLPAQRWFRPVHGAKSRLELTPVSIVVFPSIW